MPHKRDTPKPPHPTKKPDARAEKPDDGEQLDEQGEITQRTPRIELDEERR